ncbi:S-adenosylmethionine transporter [Coniosporium tulheliwenetii]|uniref:S-adenosylmethionine transporter n=1 Tax=Coniosporium tulheliwenetii TaxID=3383036 RepID=A0ACC2ZKX0_9PEZI|nr:S-adenosylmethionine transporter [Cladosporium sp. JES 115]
MQSPVHPPAWVESPYIRSLLAQASTSLYPIDTLKTRLQSSAGFAASGGFKGVYRGVGSAVVGSAPGAALFFVTYDGVKRFFERRERGRTLRTAEGRDGELGEVAACAVRVPTEVVKQRAQALQYPSSLSALTHILSLRHTHGLARVWAELYRGWGITIMRERGDGMVSGTDSAVLGAASGAVAAGITTPLDVLKTRMMLSREKVGAGALMARILRENGPSAFFAGIGPRIFWISAGGAIFLGSYQWASNVLGGAA